MGNILKQLNKVTFEGNNFQPFKAAKNASDDITDSTFQKQQYSESC
jgi:hypothetical protein